MEPPVVVHRQQEDDDHPSSAKEVGRAKLVLFRTNSFTRAIEDGSKICPSPPGVVKSKSAGDELDVVDRLCKETVGRVSRIS